MKGSRAVLTLILVGILIALGCAPAAAPVATPTPKPAEVAKPAPIPTPTSAPTPTPTKRPPEKIKVAYGSISTNNPHMFMTKDFGYFEEEGLDVELIMITAAISVKALLAGGSHEFDANSLSAVDAILQGAPLKVISVVQDALAWHIYSKPEIKTVEELKGKRIAVTSIGSSLDVTVRTILKNHKLDPDKDAIIVGAGAGAARATMLMAGTVDAALMDTGLALPTAKAGFRKLVSVPDEVKLAGAGYAVAEKTLKERPDLVKGFLRAVIKGMKVYKSGSPKVREWFREHAKKTFDVGKEDADYLYDTDLKSFNDVGYVGEDGQKFTIGVQKELLKITEDVPNSRVFDFSLVKQIGEELKNWKP